jgi:glutathione S-transferase
VNVDIFGGDTLTNEYAVINPLRETPVLELESGERIAQSPAILWYLAEGTAFVPDSRLARAHVLQWLAFEQERVMWMERLRALPGFVADLVPYPANARAGAGRSIYD